MPGDDPRLAGNVVRVIASAGLSLEAAAAEAVRAGVPAAILSDSIEGEAREIGRMHAAIAREVAARGRPFAPPMVILSGGETTVTLRQSDGRGGRNSEFLLAMALAAEGVPFAALAADTDGIDGSEDNAGAFAHGGSMARLRALGEDPAACLAGNDAWTAFARLEICSCRGRPARTSTISVRYWCGNAPCPASARISGSRRSRNERRHSPHLAAGSHN